MEHSTLPLFSLQEEIQEIPLTQGKVAIVSACDYEWLMQWKWYARLDDLWYAARSSKRSERALGAPFTLYMHRQIIGASKGQVVDHRDRNGLNNTRANIRFCTSSENSRNSGPKSGQSSLYKGVHWSNTYKRWIVRVLVKGKATYVGSFTDELEAARAYDRSARKLHGEFAWLNFQEE